MSKAGSQLYQRGAIWHRRGEDPTGVSRLFERLYPKSDFPKGHPDLATSLNNLGFLLQAQGAYGEARGYYERRWR